MKKIKVRYFAIFREQAGRSFEEIETNASTPAELYDELRLKHEFSLEPHQLQVSVNSDYSQMNHQLVGGEELVFVPPVAGG